MLAAQLNELGVVSGPEAPPRASARGSSRPAQPPPSNNSQAPPLPPLSSHHHAAANGHSHSQGTLFTFFLYKVNLLKYNGNLCRPSTNREKYFGST